ncbi:DUF1707 domain-containing protein [Streptomyces sp. WAC06614]|uniref:DUF1707 SHOCT-like domain-containing protein n=1 Tax=Streptomyces sp. WAC06614 TaxID=2487416 RepID=UPI000F79420C|nr:DUF1707 domain-containing protein [Streptomyces sp. WAC06614]RSS70295.1 DUF1707 and DUF2154 domain-containing protein [Streptomyces sp. WAC06614]
MSDERPEKPLPEQQLPEQQLPQDPLRKRSAPPEGHDGGQGTGPGAGAPLPEVKASEVRAPEVRASELRASDADRDRVAERLRDALAEGRLDMQEFEERLEATYASRTYAELEPLTRDLPAAGGPAAPVPHPLAATPAPGADTPWPARIGGAGTSSAGVAVMSGFQRKGHWTVPARFQAVAFWGGGEIDLREARFEQREVEINCVAIMGGIEIVVPPGVEVDVRGFGFMGAFDQRDTPLPPDPGAPRVVVTGFAFWGGVEVKVKARKTLGGRGDRRRKEL